MTIDTTKLRERALAHHAAHKRFVVTAMRMVALLDRLAALERVIGREIHGAISAAQEARRMGHKGVAAQLEMIATRMGDALATIDRTTETQT